MPEIELDSDVVQQGFGPLLGANQVSYDVVYEALLCQEVQYNHLVITFLFALFLVSCNFRIIQV